MIVTTTTEPANELCLRPDQEQCWHDTGKPAPLDFAFKRLAAAEKQDGARRDERVTDLRSWRFGTTRDGTLTLRRKRGSRRRALPLRELAFTQLCARFDAPPAYILSLPPKLALANLNCGLESGPTDALLRMAGGEVAKRAQPTLRARQRQHAARSAP